MMLGVVAGDGKRMKPYWFQRASRLGLPSTWISSKQL